MTIIRISAASWVRRPKKRSKFFVDPLKITVMGIHFPMTSLTHGKKVDFTALDHKVALLYHVRGLEVETGKVLKACTLCYNTIPLEDWSLWNLHGNRTST